MAGAFDRFAGPGRHVAIKIAIGLLVLIVVAAGGVALWYRTTYNVWPGQAASARVHWCGRDYEYFGGATETSYQMSAHERFPIRPVGLYPPLGFSRQELYASLTPQAQRDTSSPPPPCTMIVYLQVGPDAYRAYALEGGP